MWHNKCLIFNIIDSLHLNITSELIIRVVYVSGVGAIKYGTGEEGSCHFRSKIITLLYN